MPPKKNQLEQLRVPPNFKEVEEGVIGAILIIPNGYFRVVDFLVVDAFYVDAHKKVFKACSKLAASFLPIDTTTVCEELHKTKELEEIGGMLAVMQFINKATTNLEYHAKIIQHKYLLREIIRIGTEVANEAYENGAEANEILERATMQLYNLTKGIFKKDFTLPEKNAMAALSEINTKMQREPGTLTGAPSGFKKLDETTHGFQKSDLIILAARPSVGKTALALNLAYNLASLNKSVAFFSLEMSVDQLVQRIISSISGIPLKQIRNGNLNPTEYENVVKSIDLFSRTPIFIDDTAGLNSLELRAKTRRLVEKHNVGLIIIDYLQLMSPVEYSRGKNRNEQIQDISRDVKVISKDFEIPIIALSQLSRSVESRAEGSKTPGLSDLRDSGAIEQDADIVMFLWLDAGVTKLRIAKHRNGSLETFVLNRDMSIQKFTEKGTEPFKPKANTGGSFDDGLPEAEDEVYNFQNRK